MHPFYENIFDYLEKEVHNRKPELIQLERGFYNIKNLDESQYLESQKTFILPISRLPFKDKRLSKLHGGILIIEILRNEIRIYGQLNEVLSFKFNYTSKLQVLNMFLPNLEELTINPLFNIIPLLYSEESLRIERGVMEVNSFDNLLDILYEN